MAYYVQLNSDNLVVGESDGGATKPNSAAYLDVTRRNDGPWLGKIYDKATDTFIDPKTLDVRPIATVLIYDPADKNKTLKTQWLINEQIGIDVTVSDGQGNIVTAFNGTFGIPVMRFDPVRNQFSGPVRRLKLDFINGLATRLFAGFAESGDYGIDDRVSTLAKVVSPLIVTVLE
jgi:hypothetical protein